MIEIRVVQITEGQKKGKWIWKIRRPTNPNTKGKLNGKWISRSMIEFVDAWQANNSAEKIKKDLEENDCKNIKIVYGKYSVPEVHHKFYEKKFEGQKKTGILETIEATPYGYSIVKE